MSGLKRGHLFFKVGTKTVLTALYKTTQMSACIGMLELVSKVSVTPLDFHYVCRMDSSKRLDRHKKDWKPGRFNGYFSKVRLIILTKILLNLESSK
jgi:hypothetical protein